MNLRNTVCYCLILAMTVFACGQSSDTKVNDSTPKTHSESDDFEYNSEQFADLKILRYQIPGFDKLSAKQKELVYYLSQAGLEGRDIMWDMNYRHNLTIRKALEKVVKDYKGDRKSADWDKFMVYVPK